jgi:hypothetical protein
VEASWLLGYLCGAKKEGVMQDDICPGPSISAERATGGASHDGLSAETYSRAGGLRLLTDPTWQDLLSFILSLGAVVSILALVVLLGWDTLRRTINIEPLSVPKNLAEEKGFGPDVAARRLQDAIYVVFNRSERPTVASQIRRIPTASL